MGLDWKQPEGRNQNKRDTPHLGLERTKKHLSKRIYEDCCLCLSFKNSDREADNSLTEGHWDLLW